LLSPDLLRVLALMGHGDEIVIADANFTAQALAQRVNGSVPVLHCPGVTVLDMAQAVLSLLPLASDVDQPVGFMQVEHTPPAYRSAQQRAVLAMLSAQGHAQAAQCAAIERYAFYDRVRECQAIVLTGERQPYANLLLRKGVIGEDLVP
jgi:L-fucose mutarotase